MLSPSLRPIFLTTDIGIVLLSDLRFELFTVTVVISPSPSSIMSDRNKYNQVVYKGSIHVCIHLIILMNSIHVCQQINVFIYEG
jgi:hypothetical protein